MHYNNKKEKMQEDSTERYDEKKKKSRRLAQSYFRIHDVKRAKRVNECADYLKFSECCNKHRKLVYASFCGDRLCPMCNWRRSRIIFGQLYKMIHRSVELKPRLRFLFLTLTVRNVYADELSACLDNLLQGFNRLSKYKEIDKNLIGWIRNLEVTCDWNEFITKQMYNNPKRRDYYVSRGLKPGDPNPQYKTFHPHIHVLIGVDDNYFGASYISKEKWSAFWRKAAKLDYDPQINIKRVRPREKGQTIEGAVSETAKYSVKDSDYIKDDWGTMDEIVPTLSKILKGRRLIAYGKLFKTLAKELALRDVEKKSDDLNDDDAPCCCPICSEVMNYITLYWNAPISKYS